MKKKGGKTGAAEKIKESSRYPYLTVKKDTKKKCSHIIVFASSASTFGNEMGHPSNERSDSSSKQLLST